MRKLNVSMKVLFVVCTLALFFMMPSTAWASTEAQYSTDGGTNWTNSTFKDAFGALNNSANGGTIKLLTDVTWNPKVYNDEQIRKNITIISGNGACKIQRGPDASRAIAMFRIDNTYTLTLGREGGMGQGNTLIIDGGAVWTGDVDSTLNRGTTNSGLLGSSMVNLNGSGGTFNMYEGVTLQNNDGTEGAVSLGTSTTFNMYGGEIKNISKTNMYDRGAVQVGNSANFTMWGTAGITGCSSNTFGGAVINQGTFTMNGGTISGNIASSGAGVCQNGGIFTMNGGTITGNRAINAGNGAGVYLNNRAKIKLNGNPKINGNIKGTSTPSNVFLTYNAILGSSELIIDGILTVAKDTIGITVSGGNSMTVVPEYDSKKGANILPAPFFSDDPSMELSLDVGGGLKISPAPSPASMPTAIFEASTMTLTNVADGMKYSVDGGTNWLDITGTSVVIADATAANGIKVYMPGNGTTTRDSDVQSITLTQAATPVISTFTVTQPSTIDGTGSIAGVQSSMEYSVDNGSTWTAGGSTITGIFGGTTYSIRTKGSGAVLASESYTITINGAQAAPTGLAGVAPTTYGGNDGKITGTTTAMEYKLSKDTTFIPATDSEITGLAAGTYNVRYAAKTGFNAGAAVTVTVPAYKIPLNSVSISGIAKAGQTLTAIVDPIEAAVTYQWQAGGEGVGTNSATYTVQAEDIGKTITVTVTATATSSYTGTKTSTPTGTVTAIPITAKINGGDPIGGDSLANVFTLWRNAESAMSYEAITSIEIIGGSVTFDDWLQMKTQRTSLSGLTSFTVADTVTSVAGLPRVDTAEDRIFNINIQEVYIAKLTSIPYGVFMSIGNGYYTSAYTKLTAVNFPDVTDIGISAFNGCTDLTTANFPEAITIEPYAFQDNGLVTANFPKATAIGAMAFYGCTSLTTANFPEAISIEGSAFSGCTSLSLTTESFPKATSIKSNAFANCTSLTSVSFPLAASIDNFAFWQCTGLATANFPEAASIGNSAFIRCSSLTTVNFPVATIIGDEAFYGCTSLTAAKFPVLSSIGASAFYNCSKLVILRLPVNPPTISNANAFEKCPPSRILGFVDVNGTDLTGTALTTAQGEYKAVNDGNPSDTLWYNWYITRAAGPALTDVAGDDAANTLTGMTAAMEFSFSTDGTTWTPWTVYDEASPNLPDLTGTVTLQVRVAETATYAAGPPTTFYFTAPTLPVLSCIAITTPATKTVYKIGEDLDITGMVVTGTYSDNSTKEETVTSANVSGFDSSAVAATQTLTVTVGGKTATYTIAVGKADNPTDWEGTIPAADPAYTYSGGTGADETHPYLIANSYDLAMLAANVNAGSDYSQDKFFKLAADIPSRACISATPLMNKACSDTFRVLPLKTWVSSAVPSAAKSMSVA